MTLKQKRKRAFYKWSYGGYVTKFEVRLIQRWWKQSGRAKLQALHKFG